MFLKIISATIVAGVLIGCQAQDIEPPEFSGEQAMRYLETQVGFGPRVPGSQPWRECADYLIGHFKQTGLTVDSQAFMFLDPYSGDSLPLVNIIASHRGGPEDQKPIIYVAHWDSRPRTDYPTRPGIDTLPIAGANDGASGVAVLMELGRMFKEEPPHSNVDLVLVDGEDWGMSGDDQHYLLGARHFSTSGIRDTYHFGIVIDMVGDSDLQIYREKYSEVFNKPLNDYVWRTAKQLGLTGFIDQVRHEVLDDHMPLNIGGVRAIDLIDFDYRYWHSELDTPDKCSSSSLQQVGKLLAEIAYKPSTWPKLQ